MSDLGQDSQAKIIVRELANPIPDVSTFNMIVQSVITDNPFACVGYTSNGKTHDPIEKIKEVYTARILYKDNNGSIVDTREVTFNSYVEAESGVTAIPSITQTTAYQGSIAIHDPKFDMYDATLRCHDPNGEIYNVVITRDDVILAAYSDDTIKTRFETWANTVSSLTPVKANTKQNNDRYLGNLPDVETIF
jgi:pterin-4a-carbinolamine dehydratase